MTDRGLRINGRKCRPPVNPEKEKQRILDRIARMVRCVKCGQGNGTLLKRSNELQTEYYHKSCG